MNNYEYSPPPLPYFSVYSQMMQIVILIISNLRNTQNLSILAIKTQKSHSLKSYNGSSSFIVLFKISLRSHSPSYSSFSPTLDKNEDNVSNMGQNEYIDNNRPRRYAQAYIGTIARVINWWMIVYAMGVDN